MKIQLTKELIPQDAASPLTRTEILMMLLMIDKFLIHDLKCAASGAWWKTKAGRECIKDVRAMKRTREHLLRTIALIDIQG